MPNTKEIALFIALIVLAILFLIVIIAFSLVWSKRKLLQAEKQKHRELIRAVVQSEETQKTKIAVELHNFIFPNLTLSALNLSTKVADLQNGGSDFSTVIEEIEKLGSIAESIREIAHGIIPKMFTSFGVIKSIETSVTQLNNIDETTAIFENNTNFRSDLPYSMVYQISIYNACMEIINNLRKHSNYKALTVSLENEPGFINFIFAHDGKGITTEEITNIAKAGKGIGLMSLESLAIALEGEINYNKDVGVSTVNLKLPTKNGNND